MYAAQLSIAERFVKIGNLFFNVNDNDREYKFDLYYENTSQDPVNNFIKDNENLIVNFYKFLNSIVEFVVGIFTKTKTKDSDSFNKTSNCHRQNLSINKSNSFKNLSCQQVIQNNVRNRLLKAISVDAVDSKVKEKSYGIFSTFKVPKLNFYYFFKAKEKAVVKNRFMGSK